MNETYLVNILNNNVICSCCSDFVGALILGLLCSWVAFKEANDTYIASERSIFSKNQDYICPCLSESICTYIWCLNVRGGRKLITYTHIHTHTHTHTHTHETTTVTLAVHACQGSTTTNITQTINSHSVIKLLFFFL